LPDKEECQLGDKRALQAAAKDDTSKIVVATSPGEFLIVNFILNDTYDAKRTKHIEWFRCF
jgi:hypothetical protein